jgi:hypothetical protein
VEMVEPAPGYGWFDAASPGSAKSKTVKMPGKCARKVLNFGGGSG